MKRISLILGLLLATVLPLMADHVDPETAQKVAARFLSNNGTKTAQLTDFTKEAGFPNLYIFNANSGFVVVAADDCAKPILGFSLTDTFEVTNMPENMRWWLQQYNDEIQWGIENEIPADKRIMTQWRELKEGTSIKDTPTIVVSPLLSTNWNQGDPYNLYCPSGTVTGCVATAMAQVMKFWNYPETGQGSHTNENNTNQTVNFAEATYDWANMPDKCYSSSSDVQKRAVATLMYHCGVSVDMNYGESSGAVSSKVPVALKTYFKYAPSATYKSKESYTNEQWIAMIKTELEENRPVFYAGSYVTDDGENGGHAFVCDGYRSDDYFHFNWGWGGYKDNYFPIGALNPIPSSGSAIGSGYGTYNLSNGIAVWVERAINTISAPTITASSINGSIILSWNAIENATSYDIYRDNVKIATHVTANSYTDNDVVSGVYYEYYVRTVSGETRSNPSNCITKSTFFRDYTPSNLALTLENNNATLNWTAPANNTTTLQYATGYAGYRYGLGYNGRDTYWAEVFDPSRLSEFEGMYIEKVSVFLCFPGDDYKLYIFEDDPTVESNKLAEQSVTVTGQGWVDVMIENPTLLDCSKELWIIMFYPSSEKTEDYWFPAPSGNYDEIPHDDEGNPERYNPRLYGPNLTSLSDWYYTGENNSWLFQTYITDGTYTYNLYDGSTKVNGDVPITGTNYTVENIANNTTHQYSVKTNYYGGESQASNMVGLTLGSTSVKDLKLNEDDVMTIVSGSTLTVTGTLKNDNPAHLVIEDGAQLIHNTTDVKATMKKNIEPYTYSTDEDGWQFIASPVTENITPGTDNNLLNGTYDLYYYYEPTQYWKNYRHESFDLVPGQGYLYATNAANNTLQFAGTLTPSDASVASNTLSYELNGFNLIGNPFACNATVNSDFYVIDNSIHKVVLAETGRTIAPCEGVLVQATASGQTVSFSKAVTSKGNESDATLDLVVTNGKMTLDRIRVRQGEGKGMEKFSLDHQENTSLSLRCDGKDYAVTYNASQTAVSVNFKAAHNDTYTINVENNRLDLDYLHLIDNLTGTDIDMIQNTSYTFEARTDDYASRFKLVFNAEDNNGIFGNDFVEGKTVIIDMTGRVVATDRNAQLTPGVYILRTVNGNETNSKKIIIK